MPDRSVKRKLDSHANAGITDKIAFVTHSSTSSSIAIFSEENIRCLISELIARIKVKVMNEPILPQQRVYISLRFMKSIKAHVKKCYRIELLLGRIYFYISIRQNERINAVVAAIAGRLDNSILFSL